MKNEEFKFLTPHSSFLIINHPQRPFPRYHNIHPLRAKRYFHRLACYNALMY